MEIPSSQTKHTCSPDVCFYFFVTIILFKFIFIFITIIFFQQFFIVFDFHYLKSVRDPCSFVFSSVFPFSVSVSVSVSVFSSILFVLFSYSCDTSSIKKNGLLNCYVCVNCCKCSNICFEKTKQMLSSLIQFVSSNTLIQA